VELEITGVAAGGDGIARAEDGRVVFVEGALPGERVLVVTTEEKRDYLRARATDVIESSPDRVAPPCPAVAAGCGGCQWQHVSLEGQRRLKRDIVIDGLRRIAHLPDPPVAPTVDGVPAEAYRTTLRLAVDRDGRPAFHRWHSHERISVDTCLVAHPTLSDLAATCRLRGPKEVTLRVSAATGQRQIAPHPPRGRIDVPDDVQVGGHIEEEVGGRRWRVSASSFFQSGPAAAELLVRHVLNAVGADLLPGAAVVDAYAGIGLLGGLLAAAAKEAGMRIDLTAIESNPSAARDARVNLRGHNAKVLQLDVGEWEAPGRPTDIVIADPARTGLGKPGVAALAAAGAEVFVLVSCDPASLARDTALLAHQGYRLTRVQVVDLFPHTVHVETVSRFDRIPLLPLDENGQQPAE
jgi:23S rRNA (uracil1939-C5)-methyltransferase